MSNWKAINNIYYTHTAGYKKNTIPLNTTPFRARPIEHYRKQYNPISTSKYYGNHLSSYTNPGGNTITLKSPGSNCIGLSGVGDYMLENKEGCCHTKKNSRVIKSGHVEKKRISSNKELLRTRGKSYEKNLPIKKTNIQSNYEFYNVYCDDGITRLKKYNKMPNTKFFTNGAVFASSKILKNKVEEHKKFAKSTNLSAHYTALENTTTAASNQKLSKIINKTCIKFSCK